MLWLPSIIAAVVSLLTVFADPVQTFIAAHPAIAGILAGLGAVLAALAKSPTKP